MGDAKNGPPLSLNDLGIPYDDGDIPPGLFTPPEDPTILARNVLARELSQHPNIQTIIQEFIPHRVSQVQTEEDRLNGSIKNICHRLTEGNIISDTLPQQFRIGEASRWSQFFTQIQKDWAYNTDTTQGNILSDGNRVARRVATIREGATQYRRLLVSEFSPPDTYDPNPHRHSQIFAPMARDIRETIAPRMTEKFGVPFDQDKLTAGIQSWLYQDQVRTQVIRVLHDRRKSVSLKDILPPQDPHQPQDQESQAESSLAHIFFDAVEKKQEGGMLAGLLRKTAENGKAKEFSADDVLSALRDARTSEFTTTTSSLDQLYKDTSSTAKDMLLTADQFFEAETITHIIDTSQYRQLQAYTRTERSALTPEAKLLADPDLLAFAQWQRERYKMSEVVREDTTLTEPQRNLTVIYIDELDAAARQRVYNPKESDPHSTSVDVVRRGDRKVAEQLALQTGSLPRAQEKTIRAYVTYRDYIGTKVLGDTEYAKLKPQLDAALGITESTAPALEIRNIAEAKRLIELLTQGFGALKEEVTQIPDARVVDVKGKTDEATLHIDSLASLIQQLSHAIVSSEDEIPKPT